MNGLLKLKTERTYYSELRLAHFLDAVNKQLKRSKKVITIQHACAITAQEPAPQFYITPKQALEFYSEYKRTGKIPASKSNIRQMYEDIFLRYTQKQEELGWAGVKYLVMQEVLDEPAPSFYFNPKSAQQLYYKAVLLKRKKGRNK